MYEVRRDGQEWQLVSIVPVPVQMIRDVQWGGNEAVNYVCSGSREYCEEIKEKLEGK